MEKIKGMPKMVRVKTSYTHSFNNAMHAEYHHLLFDLITKVDKTKINISADMLAAWKAGIDLEVDINKQTTASAITKQLAEKDHERHRVLRQLFALVRAYRLSLTADESRAAEKLYVTLKPYKWIYRETDAEKCVLVVGLLTDMEKFPIETAALGLTALLTQLRVLNEEVEKLDAQRRADAVAAKLPKTRNVRRTTDEDFDIIRQCIEASYILAKSQADKEMILRLTEEMNRVNADLRASHKSSASHKAAAAAKKAALEAEKKSSDDAEKILYAENNSAADAEKISFADKKTVSDTEKSLLADKKALDTAENSLSANKKTLDAAENSLHAENIAQNVPEKNFNTVPISRNVP